MCRQQGETAIPDEVEVSADDVSPLTREQVTAGLGGLGITPVEPGHHAYLSCSIGNLSLTNLDPVLRDYRHLQVVDVSHNRLRRLDALSAIPCLRVLNASHNLLRRMDCFTLARSLEQVDMSYNEIQELGDWSNCRTSLRELRLRGNAIKQIPAYGLKRTNHLELLDLSENQITTIENIAHLPELGVLKLTHNQISSLHGLDGLNRLRELDVSNNFVKSLQGLSSWTCTSLAKLAVSNNQLGDLDTNLEILQRGFTNLAELRVSGNPIEQLPSVKLRFIYRLTSLARVDGGDVTAEDRVDSETLHGDLLESERAAWTTSMAAVCAEGYPVPEFEDHRVATIEGLRRAELSGASFSACS
ncbi:hypothetical protein FOZ63_017598 [Perkinsus olseni]|uniref:Leucine-rich repeat and WD repeat-containing protein 1 LRR domain-containing protein n=2 Tax=Perkinsus olseni TaxID=32597 RepID=A0A7J6QRD6_PEROL|nr:hypothetical protein FOZ63_017598 [Perkinsus olseni]